MHTTDPGTRDAFIAGLFALAVYLEAHPEVPVPKYSTTIRVNAASTDDGGCAEVDQFARHTSALIEDRRKRAGHYVATRSFGPVTYEMAAISDVAMARYHAHDSYYGCVDPDEPAREMS